LQAYNVGEFKDERSGKMDRLNSQKVGMLVVRNGRIIHFPAV